MKNDQLINKKYHILQRKKILRDKDRFIYNEIANRINQAMVSINFSLNSCLEIGFSSQKIYKNICAKFQKINYFAIDILEEILFDKLTKTSMSFDHDEWHIFEKKFDLIISNFYLHLTNNFDILLKNINQSLNCNGFFIATLPSLNCFKEIKNCMILADIETYGGAYKRFGNLYSIEIINQIMKKHDFKIPVIEKDILELRYKKFSSLLKDVRNLGNSYMYLDRKKTFENKKYFKKIEDIYWNRYSNNNQLILSLEIIFISGWKKDSSQQKPLKPGSAKISLQKALKEI